MHSNAHSNVHANKYMLLCNADIFVMSCYVTDLQSVKEK